MTLMRPVLKGALIAAFVLALLGAVGAFAFIKVTGLSARATPGPMETAVARRVRAWAVPADYRESVNPVLRNDESTRSGLEHFADHCAVCHGNDGSGETEMGKGVRFTGMPAWGTGTIEGEEASWHLVNFIRRLPGLTPDEIEQMEAMNPRSPAEIRQDIEAERFLQGGEPTPAEPSSPHKQ